MAMCNFVNSNPNCNRQTLRSNNTYPCNPYPESSTSSCTELNIDRCYNEQCGNHCTNCCCNMINDHTYCMLKRLCRKIIRDYSRQQCREKYTVFDGGNSVNVRIHRSSSMGQALSEGRLGVNNSARDSCSKYKAASEGQKDNLNKNNFRRKSSQNELDSGKAARKTKTVQDKESRKNIPPVDKSNADSDNKKRKSAKPAPEESPPPEKKKKPAKQPPEETPPPAEKKKKSTRPSQEETPPPAEKKRKSAKPSLEDSPPNAEKKRKSAKAPKVDNDDDGGGGRRKSKPAKPAPSENDDAAARSKSKVKKRASENDLPVISDLRAKVRKGEDVVATEKKRKPPPPPPPPSDGTHLKKTKTKSSITERKERDGPRRVKSMSSRHSQTRAVRGRRSTKKKMPRASFSSSRGAATKPSRYDQTCISDILRAKMEQRELCQPICGYDPCPPCNPCAPYTPCQPYCRPNY